MAINIVSDDIKRRLLFPSGAKSCTMQNTGDTVTSVLHNRVAGDVISFSATTGGVVIGTLYYVINVTSADVFQISATRGGGAFALNADGANTYSVKTIYDADIDSLITEFQTGIIDGLDAGYSTYEDIVKIGIIDLIAGEFLNAIRRNGGSGSAVESFALAGLSLGEFKETGDALIARGLEFIKPFKKENYTQWIAAQSVATYEKLLAEARDDDAAAQADAELLELTNKAAKVGSEKALLDAQELFVDKQALTEVQQASKLTAEAALLTVEALTEAEKPSKVIADASLSVGLAAQAQAQADLAISRKAEIDARLAVSADVGGITETAADSCVFSEMPI